MTATISTEATVARARQLLHTAADASKQLEESVRELVTMRAWDVLGYKDFSEMWEKENGFAPSVHVQALAVQELRDEGMNTANSMKPPNGHTQGAVAQLVGLPMQTRGNGSESSAVGGILRQLDAGVPAEKIVRSSNVKQTIEQHGRARPQPRRLGKTPDEMVVEGFTIQRRFADEVNEVARKCNLPKSEIYRQAVAEYLMRYRESRPVTREGEAS